MQELLNIDQNVVYQVPRYQREYSWQRSQWDELFDDLIESNRSQGHFLGTIICVNQSVDTTDASVLELIDGQQRMTTLSLLLAALLKALRAHDSDLDDEGRADVVNLRRHLAYAKNPPRPRLIPQHQNRNHDDYLNVLADAGTGVKAPEVANVGNRRIMKAYRHFQNRIASIAGETIGEEAAAAILDILEKVRRAIIVKIEVGSASDAYVLFESLNNRGLPLTPIDLIKNTLLASTDTTGNQGIDEVFETWTNLLENLGDTYNVQERFFRQFYSAFSSELPTVQGVSAITRSNLIRVYEVLINDDRDALVKRLAAAGVLYRRIIGNTQGDSDLDRELMRLVRAQGTTAHIVLLYLFTYRERLDLGDAALTEITALLTNFMVRRHLTGTPPTHRLARLFTSLIDDVANLRGKEIANTIRSRLVAESASDDQFRDRLLGAIYEDNPDVARFILAALAEHAMTDEVWADLWDVKSNKYVWTMEHIFPQGGNVPKAWEDMVGGPENVAVVRNELLHSLGNLTLTGYNSSLSNRKFEDKRDHTNEKGRYTGFRNGLSLNADLADAHAWTADQMRERRQRLAEQAFDLFRLDAQPSR
ncbi:DUF262 domain-containing protein [Mycobacterium sp. UM_WGJ]|uniref:DUF262 domain-containing protein n=1 Tax=Mycobacterium sp. UM_WGJ TaxID=1370120 RepID=UPI00041CD6F2|nr:DUF262 domain-containing protein [Mycobacterium sp. UM_WGJ]